MRRERWKSFKPFLNRICVQARTGKEHVDATQLRTLEELCGTVLLRRDTHRMSMTETGRRLLADATAMLAHAEEADRRLREDHTTLSGHLRLFATMDLGTWIVTPLVSQFLQANPQRSPRRLR